MIHDLLPVERLRELLSYDPETGIFRWLARGGRTAAKGAIAGSISGNLYRTIYIDGRNYRAHRLAWFYVTGKWPAGDLDHKDRNRDNNRFVNLREATRGENNRNSKRKNVTGLKGVIFDKRCDRWYAQITIAGARKYLGCFMTPEDAHAAYCAATLEIDSEFSRVA